MKSIQYNDSEEYSQTSGNKQVETNLNILGLEPPFTQVIPETSTLPNKYIASKSCTSMINSIFNDDDFFKRPVKKIKMDDCKSTGTLKKISIWEKTCSTIAELLPTNHSDHDCLNLFKIIYKGQPNIKDRFPISMVMLMIFIELIQPDKCDRLLDPEQMIKWKNTCPTQESFAQLKAVWETIDMCDGITSLWTAWTKFLVTIRNIKKTSPYKWPLAFIIDIEFQPDDILQMSLFHQYTLILMKSLRNLRFSPNYQPQSIIMNFESFQNNMTTTACTLPIRTHFPIDSVNYDLSTTLDKNKDNITFQEEFSSSTSQLATGSKSINITLQTAKFPYTLQAEKQMEDYIFDIKIYKYLTFLLKNFY